MSERPLCVNPRCRIPNRHAPTCAGAPCRGCLVAWAADGLRLCPVDVTRLGANAVKAATLYDELALALRPTTAGGGHSANAPGPASPPRDPVMDARADIRAVLTSWAKLVGEERGIELPWRWVVQILPDGFIGPPARVRRPDDTIAAVGRYLAKHAEWLAAQEFAGEAADELADLAGRAWGLAYPSGTRTVVVGPCPLCDGTLTAIVRTVDRVLPSEVVCDAEDEHRWAADQWRQLDRLVMVRKRAAA